MEITNLGGGVIKLSGKKLSVVAGPKLPAKVSANVIAMTQGTTPGSEDVMVLDGPGEYEVGGALITAIAAQLHIDKDGLAATNYVVRSDDVSIAVLGNIAPTLSDAQLEAMGRVDVLVVPVGGKGFTLDAEAAAKIVSQVEPKVVIPSHYDDGTNYEMPQDKVDAFIKEVGATPETVSKFKASARDLPEEMAVVIVKPEVKAAA